MGGRISAAGAKVAKAGLLLGGAAAVGVARFTNDAAKLDTGFREVVTLFGETGKAADKSLGQVSSQVRDLSDEFGIAQETLTGGLYQAISAGVPRENAFEFMQVASQAAIGGVTDVETAVDGISTTINAFGLEASDARSVADSMFTAVKGGKTTFDELSSSLFNIAPAAAAAKVEFTEVNAALATLTASGTPTSVATTQLRAALTGLQKPSEDLDGIFQKLGFSNAQTAIETEGLGFALDAVKDASKGNNGELQKLLGSSEAVAAVNVLAGTGAGKFADELDNQAKSAGATADAFDVVNASSERQLETLKTNLRNVGISIGQQLLPYVTRFSEYMLSDVVPAVERFGSYLSDNEGEIKAAATSVRDGLLPPLKALAELAKVVGGALGSLPGPLQQLAVQGGLAAAVLPRVTRGATTVGGALSTARAKTSQFAAEMTYAETRSQRLRGGLARVGSAAKGAAGVGGLLALSAGAEQADTNMGLLLTTAGGAATGFAVGGPIGGAIGGLGGLILGLSGRTDKTAESFDAAKVPAQDFAGSLDQVTGAATATTRALVLTDLQNRDLLGSAQALGISQRDLVGATLGNAGAQERVRAAIKGAPREVRLTAGAYGSLGIATSEANRDATKLAEGLGLSKRALRADQAETRAAALATAKLSEVYRGVPPKVITRIRELGGELTRRQALRIGRQYNLLPRKVNTLLRANGLKPLEKGVGRAGRQLRELNGTKVTLPEVSAGVRRGMSATTQAASRGSRGVRRELETVSRSRGNLRNYTGDISRGARAGEQAASRGSKDTQRSLERVSRSQANLKSYAGDITRFTKAGEQTAQRGATDVAQNLVQGTGRARANLGPFQSSLSGGIASARGTASSGGSGIGSALGSGVYSGIGGWISSVVSRARSLVSSAIAAARSAAKINSPSKETEYIGQMMGAGLARGLYRSVKLGRGAGSKMARGALAGVVDGTGGIKKAFEKLDKLVIRKRGDRGKAFVKTLKDEERQLLRNGRAQDAVQKKLSKATEKYKQLFAAAKEYATTIQTSIVGTGSVVGLGAEEDGTVGIGNLLSGLQDRVLAAERYADLIRTLRESGLNRTSMQQILDAGVEGGLATAEALVSGGKGAIDQANDLTKQLSLIGKDLGNTMADTYFGAGVQAAEGLAKGLISKRNRLDTVADRLATRLAVQVKRKLGIRSPSRVFQDIGDQSMRGLELGLDETYAKRIGDTAATALTDGFGRPALAAYTAARAADVARQQAGVGGRVHLTADQVSQLQRGRQVQADLDAFHAAGGRKLAT